MGDERRIHTRRSPLIDPFCDLSIDALHGNLRLLALDGSKPWPHQCERQLAADTTSSRPLVEVVVMLRIDLSDAEHCVLKLDEYFRHSSRSLLGDTHVELEVIKPTTVRTCVRRALAVEKAGSPREELLVKRLRHSVRKSRLSHSRTLARLFYSV